MASSLHRAPLLVSQVELRAVRQMASFLTLFRLSSSTALLIPCWLKFYASYNTPHTGHRQSFPYTPSYGSFNASLEEGTSVC